MSLKPWIAPSVLLVVAVVVGALVHVVFVRKMTVLSKRTASPIDDLVLASIRPHILLWFVLAGLVLGARNSPLPALHEHVPSIAAALFMVSLSFVAANVITGVVERATARNGAVFVSVSLTRNVLRGVILLVGALLVLQNLGIQIQPLLTALGVGSLAVALALQPTLSNLFAGLHVTLAKVVRVGDFVELENGTQGYVADVGWRSTMLREGANNMVVVPNARFVEMISKNYSRPEPEQIVTLPLRVAYGEDLERVEAVVLEEAREVQENASVGVHGFQPVVRFQAFGPSAIELIVVLRVTQLPERALLVHELLKRLKARFEREGIAIPYPQQVVHEVRETGST